MLKPWPHNHGWERSLQAEGKQEGLYFGMDDYVQSINHALNVHLSREQAEEPLTIGVFGAWGSGKTRVLKAVESEFEQSLNSEDFSQGQTPTIAVWFYAEPQACVLFTRR